ncbi:MAG: right-handed parallel beta-helix repeat-containing protein [Clostridia bacterium]|nr:right-handed parallel beta-helix repeat-containing protein [Clostridia bacterium]
MLNTRLVSLVLSISMCAAMFVPTASAKTDSKASDSVIGQSMDMADNKGEEAKYVSSRNIDESNPYCIYVSPDGYEGNGSMESPFSNIESAIAAARKIPKDGSYSCVKIIFRGGRYKRKNPIILTREDSGSRETPVVFTSYENERAVFTGADNIDMSKAVRITDSSVLNQLPKEVRDKVVQVELAEQGIKGAGYVPIVYYGVKKYTPQVKIIWNNSECVCARWPNGGEFARVQKVLYAGTPWFNTSLNKGSAVVPDLSGEKGFVFRTGTERTKKWAMGKDAVLYGFWKYGWAVDSVRIAGVDGTDIVFAETPVSFGVVQNGMYYVFNLLQELDSPGEWYVDKDTDILYIYPPEEIDDNTKVNVVSYADIMVDADNCDYINFENISFENTLGGVFDINQSDHFQVGGCDFNMIQSDVITITDSDYSGVVSCDMNNIGSSGINIDSNDWENLIERNCYAVNNKIEGYAQYNTTYHPAISINYSTGAYVGHNVISDGNCQAIGGVGHNCIIEFNEIYDVCKTNADMGMIYFYWTYMMAGNIIRYNYFHDTIGTGLSGWAPAIYFDELASGNVAFGNVIDNVNGALLINGGRRNEFKNNIVLNTPTQVQSPMSIYAHHYIDVWTTWESKLSFTGLFPNKSNAYREKFPELYYENDDKEWYYPRNVYIEDNVFYNGMYIQLSDKYQNMAHMEYNIEYEKGEDIGFVDEAKKDYQLREDSVIYKDIPDFEPIPFYDIGLFGDEYRTDIKDCLDVTEKGRTDE